jgi:apolipoprotein N-acyltransferase
MAFATNPGRALAALSALVSTAVLVWFGNGLAPSWPLLWFAPLPVLIFALGGSWRSAAVTAALSWLAGCLNLWHYLRALETPFPVLLGIFSISALVFAAAVLLFRALALRGALWTALMAFPATWVSYEYARNLATPHGTVGSIAYSQLDFLPLLQLASITGPWGISFLLFAFPAAVAIGLHSRRSEPKQARGIVVGCVGLIVLVLSFGAIRLTLPQLHQKVTVGLIASDQPGRVAVADEGAPTMRLFRYYAREVEGLASLGARVVVLPEKVGVVVDPDVEGTDGLFQRLADKTGSMIVVGEIRVSRQVKYNQARIYAPGVSVLTYDKHQMLPPFESDLRPGTALTLLPRQSATWGVAICKDMDFTPLSREYGQAGVGLMLVPGWDFRLDRWWHGHIAVMRGVEDGFSVVRAARDGNLTISDNRGRILAEARSDSAPVATLIAEVPVVHNATLYVRLGDWFAWFAIAVLAFAFLQYFRMHGSRK